MVRAELMVYKLTTYSANGLCQTNYVKKGNFNVYKINKPLHFYLFKRFYR